MHRRIDARHRGDRRHRFVRLARRQGIFGHLLHLGYSLQATANDGYGFVTVGANLTTQSVSSLPAQVATLSASQAVVPTLQLAIRVVP